MSIVDETGRSGPGNRRLWTWLGGLISAVIVTVVSGVVLAVVVPGGELPVVQPPPSAASQALPFIHTVQARGDYCFPYIVDQPAETLPGPRADPSDTDWPTDDEVIAWAAQVGAVPSHGRVTLTLQGTSETAVILQSAEVEIVSRAAPVAADAVYYTESGCGATVSPRFFLANLDQRRATLQPIAGTDDAGNDIPAVSFPFTVSNADPEIFIIEADPGTCDCTWRVKLRWRSGDRDGTLVIDDGGRPFRTAAFREASAHQFYEPGAGGCNDGDKAVSRAWCEFSD